MYVIVVKPRNMARGEAESVDFSTFFVFEYGRAIYEDPEDTELFYSRKVMFASDEKSAKLCAAKLAEHNPGSDVLVSPVASVFSTAKSEVVEKSVTDKGILPT